MVNNLLGEERLLNFIEYDTKGDEPSDKYLRETK